MAETTFPPQFRPVRQPTAIESQAPITVVFVVFDGCQMLDVTGPWEVFAQANKWRSSHDDTCRTYYRLVLASHRHAQIVTSGGIALAGLVPLESLTLPIDTVVVVGGEQDAVDELASDIRTTIWLRQHAAQSRRVASVCTGAFVLAKAGLLNERRATTHWASCSRLAKMYPTVSVQPDAIFVVDPPLYTSAGVTAGIDLALAMVDADLGRAAALAVARELVLFFRRAGGQSQFSTGLQAQSAVCDRLQNTIASIIECPAAALNVAALAQRAGMSERNFARVFRRETGHTPAKYVELARLDRAKSYLEDSKLQMERLAQQCGFGSVDALNRAFVRVLGVTPSDYRRRFAAKVVSGA